MRILAPSVVLYAAVAALVGCAGTADAQSSPAPKPAVRAAGNAVIFNGQINARSAADFLRLLRDPSITRLVITSGGGRVTAALDMAFAIHERQLDVEVPTASRSSCANYIFPAARNKILRRPGAVAWHGNMTHVLYLQQSGQANWNEQEVEGARQLAKREAEFFSRIGVDGFVCWFAKIPPYDAVGGRHTAVRHRECHCARGIAARIGHTEEVRPVRVDWAGLEAIRPAVRLNPS